MYVIDYGTNERNSGSSSSSSAELVGVLLSCWQLLVRRYDQMEGVSERLGVFLESSFGSSMHEKGALLCKKVRIDARRSTRRPGIDVARA